MLKREQGARVGLFCDPDPKHKSARTASARDLLCALRQYPGGGVWVIEEVS